MIERERERERVRMRECGMRVCVRESGRQNERGGACELGSESWTEKLRVRGGVSESSRGPEIERKKEDVNVKGSE